MGAADPAGISLSGVAFGADWGGVPERAVRGRRSLVRLGRCQRRTGASELKEQLARCAAWCLMAILYCSLPILPLLAAMAFMRWDFVRRYPETLRKMRLHLAAMQQGPVQHFFHDVVGRAPTIPAEIRGSCVQCGNCCMERQCAFLEQVEEDRYQCGIYTSVWRRFSNCGSYPLNQRDIDRYACPSYYSVSENEADDRAESPPAAAWVPVHFAGARQSRLR